MPWMRQHLPTFHNLFSLFSNNAPRHTPTESSPNKPHLNSTNSPLPTTPHNSSSTPLPTALLSTIQPCNPLPQPFQRCSHWPVVASFLFLRCQGSCDPGKAPHLPVHRGHWRDTWMLSNQVWRSLSIPANEFSNKTHRAPRWPSTLSYPPQLSSAIPNPVL